MSTPTPTVRPTASAAVEEVSLEQLAQVRQALGAWVDGLPNKVARDGTLFWKSAGARFRPLNADLALELGLAAGPSRPKAAMAAFVFAAKGGIAEGHLGQAMCLALTQQADAALATLNTFLASKPVWRMGAEALLEPLLQELYLSGADLPPAVRRDLFAYAFVAYRQGHLLSAASEDSYRADLRRWFMSGLPSAAQPQIGVPATVGMAGATAAALVLTALVVTSHLPSAALAALLPYAWLLHHVIKGSRDRKERRTYLRNLWLQKHGKQGELA